MKIESRCCGNEANSSPCVRWRYVSPKPQMKPWMISDGMRRLRSPMRVTQRLCGVNASFNSTSVAASVAFIDDHVTSFCSSSLDIRQLEHCSQVHQWYIISVRSATTHAAISVLDPGQAHPKICGRTKPMMKPKALHVLGLIHACAGVDPRCW